MRIDEFIHDKMDRKYANSIEVTDMILSGSTELLNPAYNKKYSEFIEEYKKSHLSETYKSVSGETLEMVNLCIVGSGSIGSNIMFNMEHMKDFEGRGQQFFEYDNWELSNLSRIPFRPTSLSKKNTLINAGYGSSGEEETNFNDPLLYECCHNEAVQLLPIGAMDIETRKALWDLRAPYITITHRDNKVMIDLNPHPVEDLDIVAETYGQVDINFLIPAMTIASEWVAKFQLARTEGHTDTEEAKVFEEITKWKSDFYERFKPVLLKETSHYGDFMYDTIDRVLEKGLIENLAVIQTTRLETYKYMYQLLATDDGLRSAGKVNSIPTDIVEKTIEAYPNMEQRYFDMSRNLLTIDEDDVKKWLKMNYYKKGK